MNPESAATENQVGDITDLRNVPICMNCAHYRAPRIYRETLSMATCARRILGRNVVSGGTLFSTCADERSVNPIQPVTCGGGIFSVPIQDLEKPNCGPTGKYWEAEKKPKAGLSSEAKLLDKAHKEHPEVFPREPQKQHGIKTFFKKCLAKES